jgi:hypothetical protein
LENGGWALFIYTSRGRNHGYKTWNLSQQSEDWFGVRQNALDTGVFTEAQLVSELFEFKQDHGEEDGEALFNQEYMCSFDAAVLGAYYGKILARLDQQGRITSVPYDPQFPVVTGWDLGIDDATAIWFIQVAGREIRVIDHMEVRGRALTDIAREVLARPYVYSDHHLPHDVETRELTSAKTRKETLESLGLRPIRPGSKLPVQDGINAARNMLPKCVFDAGKCEKGLEALRSYRVEFDPKTKTPRKTPLHDWASHSADAFRELAVQLFDTEDARKRRIKNAGDVDYDPMAPPGSWGNNRPAWNPADPFAEQDALQVRSGYDWSPF